MIIYLFDHQSTEVLILLSFFTVFPLSQIINQKCFFSFYLLKTVNKLLASRVYRDYVTVQNECICVYKSCDKFAYQMQ